MTEETKQPPRRLHAIRWEGLSTAIVGGLANDCPTSGQQVRIDGVDYEVLMAEPIPQYRLEVKPI